KPFHFCHLGDNIFGPSAADAAESLVRAVGPALESRIPWAAILGNHDQESTMSREELMSFISLMDYSVSQINPSMSDSADGVESTVAIDGFGNYNLRVQGAFGSDLANTSILNLLFLDSGDRATVDGLRTYGWIKESQLHWLRSLSEGFKGNEWDRKSLYGNLLAPALALAFFHIPIPEIRQLWYKKIVGQFQEGVSCSAVNSGVLPALVSMGDVRAVFIGHDHTNDFCGEIDGIWFCYSGGFGYHAYGKAGWPRRARIILAELGKGEKAWMGVERIKTWKCLDDENLSKIDEQVLWHC
ncbi:probable inactive purple acid phosphatase 28, partial [Macadamia integrifolia]|uniref:probable inactive purple acid phosphatase 28 n=1 Tax=Macadamia integrifolia TaxID=60698 RepID=UPI001C4EFA21